jgi:hypothetical protein
VTKTVSVQFQVKDGVTAELIATRLRVFFTKVDEVGGGADDTLATLARLRDDIRPGDIYTVDGESVDVAIFDKNPQAE